jgi:hypothetical protein
MEKFVYLNEEETSILLKCIDADAKGDSASEICDFVGNPYIRRALSDAFEDETAVQIFYESFVAYRIISERFLNYSTFSEVLHEALTNPNTELAIAIPAGIMTDAQMGEISDIKGAIRDSVSVMRLDEALGKAIKDSCWRNVLIENFEILHKPIADKPVVPKRSKSSSKADYQQVFDFLSNRSSSIQGLEKNEITCIL